MNKRTAVVWHRSLAVLLFGFIPFYTSAQKLEQTLATYAAHYGQERAYLHYDKAAYAAGETVWFKAYLMEGIFPATGSKTLYVDWVDEKGTVLKHNVSPVVDAVSNGQFDIPEDYSGHFIHVRAYTKWMLNFDSSFLYSKDIRIAGKPQNNAPKPAAANTELQFFAEGGDAVAGLKNKIAFKATNPQGLPVLVSGVVQNSKGAEVAAFAAQHDGMGFFYLEPAADDVYTAKWKDAKGAVQYTKLPFAKPSGITLQLVVEDAKRRFEISRTANAAEPLKQLHLVGTMGETLVFKADIDLATRTTASGVIPTNALPSGIVTITVFNADWQAVAERITFINNNDFAFTPELTVEHWGLNRRARNEIRITVPDSIEASFSVSVTDNVLPADSSDNIMTRLLLTSEIKGYVHRPEYYFTGNNNASQHADLVMLTHGWRRFKWEDVTKGKLPAIAYPKDTAYLSLSGKLYGMPPGGASGSIIMFIKAKDSSSKMVMEGIGADGSFNNPQAFFFDTLQVYYQLQPAKVFNGADVRFMQGRLPPLNYTTTAKRLAGYKPSRDTAGNYRYALVTQEITGELMKQKTLENVTVQVKQKSTVQALDEKYASGMFAGMDGYQFDLVNDRMAGSFRDIFSYLQGKVAGLQISNAGGRPTLQWRGGAPAVFLDQINTDVDMLASVSVNDIAYVKVFRPPFMGGSNSGNGAIAIYTRKGNDVPATPGKRLNSNTITGYTPAKQFYVPNYTITDRRNEQRDVRTTLYWNPAVSASPKKRTVTLTFYNNDVTQAFRVVIEGMSKDGRLAHVEQVME
jgi:hypothetical protein